MRITEQQGYIGMTGQREVDSAARKARRRRALRIVELLSVTARLRLRARAHPPYHPFPSLARENGERLWLVQGDHGRQSNDFDK
jgi:hypothetical protein